MDAIEYAAEMRWEWAPIHPAGFPEADDASLMAAIMDAREGIWEPYERDILDEYIDLIHEEILDRG